MSNTFWLNNPMVLSKNATEIWPSSNLDYAGKLNAITRLVILLTVLGYITTRLIKVLISGLVTIVIIAIIYKVKKHKYIKKKINKKSIKEGFANNYDYEKNASKFTEPQKNNPLMNVLLPEIKYNPKRKMAAPSFNRTVEKKINKMAGNVGPDPRLFLDLGDTVSFEQSMRNFYSTANTKVPNDQTAFAKYCYGDMPSCKEGDAFQCTKDNQRYTLF